MLSISDFSEMCQLTTQTLRFYHAEGLLVPSHVDERTGYRSYEFNQVERAMLITTLRNAGISVQDVRRVLDEPDETPTLLDEHEKAMRRRRELEDEAIDDARALIGSWPEVSRRRVAETTVVSMLAPALPVEEDAGDAWGRMSTFDWNLVNSVVPGAVNDLLTMVESCGGVLAGTPWKAPAIETKQQKRDNLTRTGPHWLIKVPVASAEPIADALPDGVELQTFEAREELAIFLPGRDTLPKSATAISRLLTYPFETEFPDASRMRHILHDDGVEHAIALASLDAEATGP